jgi:hypothetical protein
MEDDISSIIIRAGIIIGLSALVGWCITNAVMLTNFLRRMPRGKIAILEFFAVFITGGLGKKYMTLLKDSNVEPTGCDKMLCMSDRICTWFFIGSIILLVIGVLGRIGG